MVSDCVLLHYHDDGQRYGEHFCVLTHHLLIYIFGEMSLNVFSMCSNWTVCFLLLSLRVFLYILDMSAASDMWFANVLWFAFSSFYLVTIVNNTVMYM